MNYISKPIAFSATIPNTAIGATDYLLLYSNNGSGSIDLVTPMSSPVFGVASGSDFIFTWRQTIKNPGSWKFKFIAYDAHGNAGTASSEYTEDLTDMIPLQAPALQYSSYDDTEKALNFTI